jgi:hypothetical protein
MQSRSWKILCMPDKWLHYQVTKHKPQVFVAEQYYYHQAMLILSIYVDRQ